MFGFSRPKLHCGLQILDRQVKLIAAAGSSCNRIAHYRRIPLGDGLIREGKILDEPKLIQALARAVDDLSLKERHVTLTIPTTSIVLRKAVFPPVKDKELRNLIDVELHGGTTQLPFRKPVFDYVRAGQKGGQQEVLIFASPMDVVEQYARVAKRAGLEPFAVDSTPLALYRLFLKGLKDTGITLPTRFMFLDAESDRAEISIFVNGYPVFFRSVLLQAHQLVQEDEDRTTAYSRQLSVELGRIMNYYKYSVASEPDDVNELILIGEPDLTGSLSRALMGEFSRITPLPMDAAIDGFVPEYKSFAVPIGLAMKGA